MTLKILHSSDVHVDDNHIPAEWDNDPLGGLRRVLNAAVATRADAVLLAGDTFENNRAAGALVAAFGALVDAAGMPVIVLPGNHDPAMAGSVYHRLEKVPGNLAVLGVTHGESVILPGMDIEFLGVPHRDHGDMHPLPAAVARRARHRIVLAHGHYVPARPTERWLPSWLFTDADLLALDADYVALGHWNRHAEIGPAQVVACYSGSPDHARTANLAVVGAAGVRFSRVDV